MKRVGLACIKVRNRGAPVESWARNGIADFCLKVSDPRSPRA